MRRFFAFIIMAVSILSAVIFNTQAVMDSRLVSLEYGGGRELVYALTERENGAPIVAREIGDNVLNRLDLAGIKNADVELDGKDQLRITFAAQTTTDYENARELIEAQGELTVCAANEECISASRFFKSQVASVYYSGLAGFPGLNIKSKAVYDEIVAHAAESTEESLQTTVFIWENKTAADSYATAFDESDPDEEMQKKIIATIDVAESYNESLNAFIIQSDNEGRQFTTSSARAWVNARNSADYGCDIKYLYENKVAPTLGADALNMTLLGVGISLILLAVLLALFYGISGLVAAVSIAGGLLIDILIFSFLGFEFSPAALLGVIVTLVLGVYISVSYFERVKDELSKGRSIAKANQEGYRKSFMGTLDVSALVFFISLFAFLIGKGTIKAFAGVTMIGALAIFIVTNFLNKWMMYWLTTSTAMGRANGGFGLKARRSGDEAKAKAICAGGRRRKTLGIGGIVAGLTVAVSVASLIGFGVSGHLFNYSDAYLSHGRIDLKTTDETYLDKDSLLEALTAEGIEIEYTDMTFNRVEMTDEYDETYYTTYVSFLTPKKLTDDETINNLTMFLQNNDEEATVLVTTATPAGMEHNTNSFFLVLGLTCLFAALYLLCRYGLYVALASLGTFAVSGLFGVGLTALFRLPFNMTTGFGFLAGAFIVAFAGVSVFARFRDLLRDSKTKKPTMEQRAVLLDQALRLQTPTLVGSFAATTVLTVVCAAFCSEALISALLVTELMALLGFILIYLLTAPLYLVVRNHLKFKTFKRFGEFFAKIGRRIGKRAPKTPAVNKNEPHETIVPGINDYR